MNTFEIFAFDKQLLKFQVEMRMYSINLGRNFN